MEPADLDVAIVGGGLAGNLLARQLVRSLPGLRVAIFEKSASGGYKVGESTAEIAANYLIRRLGLSRYLYEEHLPKNGLRYFFDDEAKSAAIHEMSEIGGDARTFHPTFQIDRARMERDLLEMNGRDGVRLRVGAQVRDIELGEDGALHRFRVEEKGSAVSMRSRWLVDAAGRAGLLARLRGLRVREAEHRVGSVWARFEGVREIDWPGPESFRARVRYTDRRLSTVHFWYSGYWIWLIPLRGGLTSVGVTGEAVASDSRLRREEGLRAFLGRHRAIAELLEGAKLVDVGSFSQIAYGTRRFFHADRWGLSGESATAADPLYSPGSDFIALENDLISDLVARDLKGESREDLAERCDFYDRFMAFRHEAAMLLYRGLYGTQGSYELACAKWDLDIGSYYNLWAASYMRDEHLSLGRVRRQLDEKEFVLSALRRFSQLFRRVEAELRGRDDYHRGNLGNYRHGLQNLGFYERIGLPRRRHEVFDTLTQLYNGVRAQALDLLDPDRAGEGAAPLPLDAFVAGDPLG